MKLKNFNNLVTQVILENSTTITYNTFNYKFDFDENQNKTFCTFESIDKSDNKLIKIKATIFENNSYEFQVTKDNNKPKIYTDKEFLLAYYKEYQDFKKAYALYKKENQEEQQIKNNEENQVIDGKNIPKINNFNDVLTQVNDNKDGILIKIDGVAFTIKQVVDEKYKNLLTIAFSFDNDNSLQNQTDLATYDAIALAKIADPYIMILNINLYDPENLKQSTPVAKLTETQFKDAFLNIYFKLENAMQEYLTQFLTDKKF